MGKCCPMMAEILKRYPLPFYYPISFSLEGNDLQAGRLGVKLYQETRTGNISKKGSTTAYLNFCPWCGTKLQAIFARAEESGDD